MTDEQAVDMLLEPIEPEAEEETDEAPQDETEPEEPEAEDDASEEVADENDDEADEEEADETDEDDEEDEEQPADRYIVKVDGEEREVTLDELKRGYSGQAYIQKGMEDVKAKERQITEFAQSLQQERQALMQLYQQAQSTGFKPAPQEPDPAMMQTDPIGYMEAEARYRQEVKAYQQTQAQIRYHQEQAQAQQERQMQELLAQQREILLEAMPELKDPEKGKAVQKAWIDTAKAYGFTSEDLNNVTDARTFQMLDDARKWRELQAGKKAAKKPREEAKAVTRPKGKMRDGGRAQWQKQLAKAKKTQRDDDFVSLLFENP
jgi:small-conductance mechanosensitive channel